MSSKIFLMLVRDAKTFRVSRIRVVIYGGGGANLPPSLLSWGATVKNNKRVHCVSKKIAVGQVLEHDLQQESLFVMRILLIPVQKPVGRSIMKLRSSHHEGKWVRYERNDSFAKAGDGFCFVMAFLYSYVLQDVSVC